MIKRALKIVGWSILTVFLGLSIYAFTGWYDARSDAPRLQAEAQQLIANGQGVEMLGPDIAGKSRLAILLLVEDPGFYTHSGIDFSTSGAGVTTITQGLSKRLAFTQFRPGIGKIRQSTYAMGLESRLSKQEILALVLHENQFRTVSGRWIKGYKTASQTFFGKPLVETDDDQFILMIASAIAPRDLNPDKPNAKLLERARRIKRLADGSCKPRGHNDVWLDGCR
jgi:monofunctional glycosyltransferase